MKIILYILLILLAVFLVVAFIHCKKTNRIIKDCFNNFNVIVYGAKGKGKDLLFSKSIYLNRKKTYSSNIDYGYDYLHRSINDLSLEPNTYKAFVNGDINKIERLSYLEGVDYYLSDGGVYLPSQYDSELHKKYPSFSLYYALSRHLYNSNIHINTQALSRIWKAAREQADKYIRCLKVVKLPSFLLCKICVYDNYNSAENNLLPMRKLVLNKYGKAELEQYKATHGDIQIRYYIIRKKDIKYDTRHFKKVVF